MVGSSLDFAFNLNGSKSKGTLLEKRTRRNPAHRILHRKRVASFLKTEIQQKDQADSAGIGRVISVGLPRTEGVPTVDIDV